MDSSKSAAQDSGNAGSTGQAEEIKPGDRVLLYLDERRTWLVEVKGEKNEFHTHAGIISIADIIGKRFGDTVSTSLGAEIFLLRPSIVDYVMKSERRTQIVYPKDFSYISARSGVHCGSIVLECGTGSGALTTYLASLVSPLGRIDTFEERTDFLEVAKKNIEKAQLSEFVEFHNSSLLNFNLLEGRYDLALLDTGDIPPLLDKVHSSLKGSSFLFCICPTTNQAERVAVEMKKGFVDIECVEILLRRIEARLGKTRPSMRMIGHTCYLVSGRKINKTRSFSSPSL
jgi:tRNA (adenine57-N1/adenine58-N1)-methyltransferase